MQNAAHQPVARRKRRTRSTLLRFDGARRHASSAATATTTHTPAATRRGAVSGRRFTVPLICSAVWNQTAFRPR